VSRFEQNSEIFDKQTWEDFRDKVTDISPLSSPPPNKDEVERFAKVTTAIADSVESAQPFADFMDPSLPQHFKNFENIINTLHNGNLFQQIPSLNNRLTAILQIIWPFVSKSDAARAAGQAVRRYRKLIEEEETEISKMRTDADTAYDSISDINSISKEYHQELFEGTDQKASIKSEIETAASKIDEMFEETSTFYRQLTQGDAESISIQNDILNAQQAARDDSSKIADLLLETENKLKELNRIYSEVVGKDENSKGHDENSKGLKAQLYDRREQLNAMVEDYEEKIKIYTKRLRDCCRVLQAPV